MSKELQKEYKTSAKTRIVEYENLDFGYRYIADKRGYIYDTYMDEFVSYSIPSHGYWSCYLCDIHGELHDLLVHRVIANTWIGDTTGKHVHHQDENRLNPKVSNLIIIEPEAHWTHHNRGSNNSTAKLTEHNVRQVCEMLEKGFTHYNIARQMSDVTKKFITVDSIDKISNGSNWTHVTKDYNLKKEKRETMNEFSDQALEIARMKAVEGLSNKQIAKRLGVDTNSKSYQRLKGCIPRYVQRFYEGYYGLFRKQS